MAYNGQMTNRQGMASALTATGPSSAVGGAQPANQAKSGPKPEWGNKANQPAPATPPAPSSPRTGFVSGGQQRHAIADRYRRSPRTGPTGAGDQGGTFLRGSVDGVRIADPNFGSMQKFQDAAYDHAMRSLQPAFDQQDRRFEQDLVNKGIDPNSAAGRLALERIQRGQNDARSGALFQAMQFGQGAQDQAFRQGAMASQLAQADSHFSRGLAENRRQFNDNLGWAKDSFGQNREDRNLGMLGNLMFQMQGVDQGIWGANNQADYNQFNARQGVASSIPGWNPAMIDVNGSANASTNSFNAANNAAMATSPWNALGSLGGAWLAGGGGNPFGG